MILFAARPCVRAPIIGIPPATLASKATQRLYFLAQSKTSLPCVASKALLAVTMCLPEARESKMAFLVQVVPPASSTTTSREGSFTTSSQWEVIIESGILISLGFEGSRTAILVSSRGLPAFFASLSCCSNSNLATPVPTTPKPIIPIFKEEAGICIIQSS